MVAGIGKHMHLIAACGGLGTLGAAIPKDLEGVEVIIVDEAHMMQEDIYKHPPPPERPTPRPTKRERVTTAVDLATWRGKQGREAARRLRQMQRRAEKNRG